LLGADSAKVQPIFITVDPERDTPAALAEYVTAFHPTLIGLTGTPDQVAEAAKNYYVRYTKMSSPSDGESSGDDDEYFVGHTSSTYLIGPNGGDLHVFNYGDPPEVLAERIQHFINSKL
jgi:protein SCO1/2